MGFNFDYIVTADGFEQWEGDEGEEHIAVDAVKSIINERGGKVRVYKLVGEFDKDDVESGNLDGETFR